MQLASCLPRNRKITNGIVTGVGAGGAGAGGYLGHQAVMDKYSKRTFRSDRGVADTYKVAGAALRDNASAAASRMHDSANAATKAGTKAGRKAYQGIRRSGEGVIKAGLGGLNKGVRAAISKLRA